MKHSGSAGVSRDCIQVTLDGVPQEVGTCYLSYNGQPGTQAFAYAPSWLERPDFFDLDPHLLRCEGEQFTPPSLSIFGMLRDTIPDRWGRMLLGRAEALAAGLEHRPIRILDEKDYLLAVEDVTRVGALRFYGNEGSFLKESTLLVPTLQELRSLAGLCLNIDKPESEQHPEYATRLARLVSAGASLGGARPKASYVDTSTYANGATQLWIAKFPAMNDDYDVGAWEFLLNQLALKAKISVPEAKLLRLGGPHSTFCAARIDRLDTHRIMYASAMTCLQRQDGDDEVSYLDIAEFITVHVAQELVKGQLEQLFRRVVFNILAGNRDDHLRNHGFLRGESGWELSHAFDMNPSPTRREHAIKIDDTSAEPDLDRVMETAGVFQLNRKEAAVILDEIASVVSTWRDEALKLRISRREIQMMQEAFA